MDSYEKLQTNIKHSPVPAQAPEEQVDPQLLLVGAEDTKFVGHRTKELLNQHV